MNNGLYYQNMKEKIKIETEIDCIKLIKSKQISTTKKENKKSRQRKNK